LEWVTNGDVRLEIVFLTRYELANVLLREAVLARRVILLPSQTGTLLASGRFLR